MTEIISLRCSDVAPGSFIDKAQTLLTYGWSKSDWHARANILRTVDWLLRMERVRRRGLEVRPDRPASIVAGGVQ